MESIELNSMATLQMGESFPFIGAVSDPGRVRLNNQDCYWVPPREYPTELLESKGYLCIVADGMGGHAQGQVASAMAVERVVQAYYSDSDVDVVLALERAIHQANDAVYAAGQTLEYAGMGTTVVAVVLKEGRAMVANVGDSRAYLISQGSAQQVTTDHSQVQEMMEQGLLTPEQAQDYPYRHVITRAIGVFAETLPDLFEIELKPSEAILLCSDGLSNLLDERDLIDAVMNLAPMDAAQELVDLANLRGGTDNITAVVLKYQTARYPSA
jgi:protein phosphatase